MKNSGSYDGLGLSSQSAKGPAPRPPVSPHLGKSPAYRKAAKETPTLLMSVISALSATETHEQRTREKTKLEKEYKESDKRLDDLITKRNQEVQQCMETFSLVSQNITEAKNKVKGVKNTTIACKQLLHCRQDDLKRLWLEGMKYKYISSYFEQIEELKNAPDMISSHIAKKEYLEATDLVSGLKKIEDDLKSVEALNELRSTLLQKKQELYACIMKELQVKVYKQTDMSETNDESLCVLTEKSLLNADIVATETKEYIAMMLKCLDKLQKVGEGVENLKKCMQRELQSIVGRATQYITAQEFKGLDDNPKAKLEKKVMCLLQIIFSQFRQVLGAHAVLLDGLRHTISPQEYSSLQPYDLSDVWSKMQAVLQLLLSHCLDMQNTQGLSAYKSLDSGSHQSRTFSDAATFKASSYFSRKRPQRPKPTLFQFDATSHAMSMNSYIKEQQICAEGQMGMAIDNWSLVAPSDPSNITIIFSPLMNFVNEVEFALRRETDSHSTLYDFVTDYVRDVFCRQVDLDVSNRIEEATKRLDSWESVRHKEEIRFNKGKKPLLQSAVLISNTIDKMKNLMHSMPMYAQHFHGVIFFSLLQNYKETCQAAYRGIVQPEAEDKRVISANWARDEDISRFLKSLPNWHRIQEGRRDDDMDESPEEVKQRTEKEAEILTGNLGDTEIPKHEILGDIVQFRSLAQLHESLEWFSGEIKRLTNDSMYGGESEGKNEKKVTEEWRAKRERAAMSLRNLAEEFQDIADSCLLVLHLEVRVYCFYYLRPLLRQGSFWGGVDTQEAAPEVLKLTKGLSQIEETLSSKMQSHKTRYIWEGLGPLLATLLISAAPGIRRMNAAGIKRMSRNIFVLQQCVTSVTLTRETALDRARQYYELLYLTAEDILNQVLEHGPKFSELEYMNLLQLVYRSTPGSDNGRLQAHLHKLSDILGDKGVTV